MRIVIDLTPLADNFSGIERYALNISKEMLKTDNSNKYILLFKNSVDSSFNNLLQKDNVEYKVIPGSGRVFFSQIKLVKILYKIKADRYLFLAFPGPIFFKRKGIFNTIHDLTGWDYPSTMKFLPRMYFKVGILNAIRVSKKILTVSKFSKKRIMDKFGAKNVEIIYNGISEVFENSDEFINDEIIDNVRKQYCLPDKYLMCLCTLEPRKNLELLIRAFVELKEEHNIDYKLVLVGRKGWKVENLLTEISQKYKGDIIVTGFVEDKYLPVIYKLSDCFIFPSLYEGFGIPVIEAMYMNVPVICSDSSSLPEVVDGNGLLFKNNDKKDLKKKILYYLNMSEEERKTIIEKGRRRAETFKWNDEAAKLIKIVEVN